MRWPASRSWPWRSETRPSRTPHARTYGSFLYRTTTLFLEKLGLDTVDELPSLAPFLPDDV